MPNSLPSRSTETIQQSINIQITGTGTTQTVITNVPSASSTPTTSTVKQQTLLPTATPRLIDIIRRRLTPSPSVKPQATSIPTPTTVAAVSPTKIPATPIPTKPVSTTATPTPASSSTTTVRDYIMNGINNYRHSLGLSTVQISDETCTFAKTRAKEITTDFSHAGFQNRIAAKTIPYKSWTLITENIAMTSNYQNVVNMWINSPGHAANMQKDTPFICVENSGNYYAYEGMRP